MRTFAYVFAIVAGTQGATVDEVDLYGARRTPDFQLAARPLGSQSVDALSYVTKIKRLLRLGASQQSAETWPEPVVDDDIRVSLDWLVDGRREPEQVDRIECTHRHAVERGRSIRSEDTAL